MASALVLPIPASSCCNVKASAVFRFRRLAGVWAWLTAGAGSFGRLVVVGAALRLNDRLANRGSRRCLRMDLRIRGHSCEVGLKAAAPWLLFQASGSRRIRPVRLGGQWLLD